MYHVVALYTYGDKTMTNGNKQPEPEEDFTVLTDKETRIRQTACLIHQVTSARAKKELTKQAPDVMGWSKAEKALFHYFLKDMALEEERKKAVEKTAFLTDFVTKTNEALKRTPAKIAQFVLFSACFLIGTDIAQRAVVNPMPENTPREVQNKQFVQGMLNAGVIGLGLGAASYGGLVVFSIAANRTARRRLKKSQENEVKIDIDTDLNRRWRTDWQREIRQQTRA